MSIDHRSKSPKRSPMAPSPSPVNGPNSVGGQSKYTTTVNTKSPYENDEFLRKSFTQKTEDEFDDEPPPRPASAPPGTLQEDYTTYEINLDDGAQKATNELKKLSRYPSGSPDSPAHTSKTFNIDWFDSTHNGDEMFTGTNDPTPLLSPSSPSKSPKSMYINSSSPQKHNSSSPVFSSSQPSHSSTNKPISEPTKYTSSSQRKSSVSIPTSSQRKSSLVPAQNIVPVGHSTSQYGHEVIMGPEGFTRPSLKNRKLSKSLESIPFSSAPKLPDSEPPTKQIILVDLNTKSATGTNDSARFRNSVDSSPGDPSRSYDSGVEADSLFAKPVTQIEDPETQHWSVHEKVKYLEGLETIAFKETPDDTKAGKSSTFVKLFDSLQQRAKHPTENEPVTKSVTITKTEKPKTEILQPTKVQQNQSQKPKDGRVTKKLEIDIVQDQQEPVSVDELSPSYISQKKALISPDNDEGDEQEPVRLIVQKFTASDTAKQPLAPQQPVYYSQINESFNKQQPVDINQSTNKPQQVNITLKKQDEVKKPEQVQLERKPIYEVKQTEPIRLEQKPIEPVNVREIVREMIKSEQKQSETTKASPRMYHANTVLNSKPDTQSVRVQMTPSLKETQVQDDELNQMVVQNQNIIIEKQPENKRERPVRAVSRDEEMSKDDEINKIVEKYRKKSVDNSSDKNTGGMFDKNKTPDPKQIHRASSITLNRPVEETILQYQAKPSKEEPDTVSKSERKPINTHTYYAQTALFQLPIEHQLEEKIATRYTPKPERDPSPPPQPKPIFTAKSVTLDQPLKQEVPVGIAQPSPEPERKAPPPEPLPIYRSKNITLDQPITQQVPLEFPKPEPLPVFRAKTVSLEQPLRQEVQVGIATPSPKQERKVITAQQESIQKSRPVPVNETKPNEKQSSSNKGQYEDIVIKAYTYMRRPGGSLDTVQADTKPQCIDFQSKTKQSQPPINKTTPTSKMTPKTVNKDQVGKDQSTKIVNKTKTTLVSQTKPKEHTETSDQHDEILLKAYTYMRRPGGSLDSLPKDDGQTKISSVERNVPPNQAKVISQHQSKNEVVKPDKSSPKKDPTDPMSEKTTSVKQNKPKQKEFTRIWQPPKKESPLEVKQHTQPDKHDTVIEQKSNNKRDDKKKPPKKDKVNKECVAQVVDMPSTDTQVTEINVRVNKPGDDEYDTPSGSYSAYGQNRRDSADGQLDSQGRASERISSSPATARNNMSSRLWVNRAEEICRSEVGNDEFEKRKAKQDAMFKKGCQKGSIIDSISVLMAKSSIKSMFEKKAKETKKRAMVPTGVGAGGYAVFDTDDRMPENAFFAPGRVYEVRARHGNNPWADDDRRICCRSLSLKFADHDKESPLDLVLQTGYISPYFNTESIEEYQQALQKGGEYAKRYLLSMPIYLQAAIDGFRKRPDSYYHQHYHSQMVYDFKGDDDKKRVCRFRAIPADGSPESGKLSPTEQRDAWYYMLLGRQEEDLPPNYLRTEFRDRLNDGPLQYKLQAQVRQVTMEDTHMVYNASVPWEEKDFPWYNLGTIVLNQALPDDVIDLTRYNIGNIPKDTLEIPDGTSVYDFNIVPTMRKEVYFQCQKHRPSQPTLEPKKSEVTEYLIHLVTGNQTQAGNMQSACNLHISIIGTDGRTPFRKLERKLKSDFDKGSKTTFSVFDNNVGDFLCAKLFKDRKGTKTDWFLEYVVVTLPYSGKCYVLPCYRWFTDDTPMMSLRDGSAMLEANESHPYLKLQRQMELAEKQRLYRWRAKDEYGDFEGLPGFIDAGDDPSKLPNDLRVDNEKSQVSAWTKHNNGRDSFLTKIMNLFKSRKGNIEPEYEKVVKELVKEPSPALEHIMRTWKDDAEFARQLINGLCPSKITEIRDIPDNFPVEEQQVKGLLEPGTSLRRALQDGKIFLISYPELEEFAQLDEPAPDYDARSLGRPDDDADTRSINSVDSIESLDQNGTKKDKKKEKKDKKEKEKKEKQEKKEKEKEKKKNEKLYLCAPQVLLYNKQGTLMPLAIQLTQEPEQYPVIYTPRDNEGVYSDWLVAKIWVRVADANVHQFSTHILGSHLIMEPMALAALRNLPIVHPVMKLIAPHLRHLISTNSIYRKALLNKDGALSEVFALASEKNKHIDFMRQKYADFKIPMLYIPDEFAERGVLEEEVLPGYTYREDSLRTWECMQEFVTEIITLYYADDEEVESDTELANMLQDLQKNGYHRRVGVTDSFSTLEELIKFTTIIMYHCSVLHSVSNAKMHEYFAYAPNCSPGLYAPPPNRKRESKGWSDITMREMLPAPEMCERLMDLIKLMCPPADDTRLLGNYPDRLFTEDRAVEAIKTFQNKLKGIEEDIKSRSNSTEEGAECPDEYFSRSLIQANINS